MTTIASTYQFAGGETWEADNLNNNVNTPLEDLLGRNGLKFREASVLVLPGPGDRYLLLPVGTTGQRPTSPAAWATCGSTAASANSNGTMAATGDRSQRLHKW